jgi:hypothetical protein
MSNSTLVFLNKSVTLYLSYKKGKMMSVYAKPLEFYFNYVMTTLGLPVLTPKDDREWTEGSEIVGYVLLTATDGYKIKLYRGAGHEPERVFRGTVYEAMVFLQGMLHVFATAQEFINTN